MKQTFKITFLFFLIYCSLNAQDSKQKLEDYFSVLASNDQFNGNVLVVENGKVLFEKSYGYADFASKKHNTANTVFPIASISKTLVATAILQLAEKGQLNLTDPVTQFFPEFPYPEIKIRHLLSHTSGLPAYNAYFDSLRKAQPTKVFTNKDFMAGLAANKKPLKYAPGEKGNYDNIPYIILALVVDKVSGMPFTEYIDQKILKPAGMNHTVWRPKLPFDAVADETFAFPHLQPRLYSDDLVKAKDVPYIVDYWSAYHFTGFSDYVSTTHDLLQYDQAYYNGSLLQQSTIDQALVPVKLNDGKNHPRNFGLGWEIEKDSTYGKIAFHVGNATGHSCILLRNISKKQTIIVFDNIHDNNSREVALNALKLVLILHFAF